MVKDINFYRAIHNATGCNTRKQMEIETIRKRLARDFENPLDIYKFTYFFDNNKIELEIVKETKSDINGYQREFKSLISSPVYHGDTFYEEESGLYWICTEVMCKSRLYYSGKLTRCNSFLKWQDENGNIFEYPVFDINSTQYNSGISSNKTLTLASAQHLITIAADENTIALQHDKRFFNSRNTKNPSVFKLTQNDTTVLNYDKGLLKITVTEDQYNPDTDSIEEWLCDYQPPQQEITTNITYNGEPKIRIGRSKTFKSDSPTTFSLVVSDIAKDMVHLTQTDVYSCKVSVDNKPILVGASFKLITNNQEILIEIQGGV